MADHQSIDAQVGPAIEAPWLNPETQGLVNILLRSHQRAFGTSLLACDRPGQSGRLASQELFATAMAVLAHDGSSDPRLTYANATAIQLWHRPWNDMVGMHSRLTAPASERQERAAALNSAQRRDAYRGYRGIRMDSKGRRFVIHNARIWTLWDDDGQRCGQAAAFASWWWL